MEIKILERDDNITHVALVGRLDATAAEELDQRLSDATAGRERPTIVELSEIEFIASRGIGLLIVNGKRLKKVGHSMVLLNPHGMVEAVLRSSKVDLVVPVAYDLEEAIQILRGGPTRVGAGRARPKISIGAAAPQRPEPVPTAPQATQDVLKLALKNELSELATLNAALAQFLEAHSVPERAAYAVNLAVEELIVNVIRYAYIDDDRHTIDFELTIEGGRIIIRIVDDGRPFDPREGPEFNIHAEDRQVGGLGLVLVLDMVEALHYQRANDKNRVEVRVALAIEDEGSDLSKAMG